MSYTNWAGFAVEPSPEIEGWWRPVEPYLLPIDWPELERRVIPKERRLLVDGLDWRWDWYELWENEIAFEV